MNKFNNNSFIIMNMIKSFLETNIGFKNKMIILFMINIKFNFQIKSNIFIYNNIINYLINVI